MVMLGQQMQRETMQGKLGHRVTQSTEDLHEPIPAHLSYLTSHPFLIFTHAILTALTSTLLTTYLCTWMALIFPLGLCLGSSFSWKHPSTS